MYRRTNNLCTKGALIAAGKEDTLFKYWRQEDTGLDALAHSYI